jgi:stearoyl-CoA desaturase (delta-9 desaturase)
MKQEDVEKWVGFARKVERSAPLVSSTVLATITSFGLDSPRFDRARNEFAASLLAVPVHRANTEGLELLRSLGACVPNEDAAVDDTGVGETLMATMKSGKAARRGGSDVIILPVQRAVNVVKACQKWVEGQDKAADDNGDDEEDEESEEDEDEGPSEDLESAMLAVFIGLAPILQNVPGKHWEFVWDVLETVLEVSGDFTSPFLQNGS